MRYRLVLTALSPIAHADARTGTVNLSNSRLFMTQPCIRNGRLAYTPHVSENALRTAMLRAPLADHLLQALGIGAGEVPRPVLSLLFSGGRMGGARIAADETLLGHAVKEIYPSLDLLGGAVDAFILPRSRLRVTAVVVGEEYLGAIEALFPELAGEARAVSVFDLVGEETRTRGTSEGADGNKMLYAYETLAVGARIALELTLDPWTRPATAAAIARALAQWDGYIGGQARQGRGRCALDWLGDAPTVEAYDAHLAEHNERMRAGLLDGTLGTGHILCALAA